MRIPRKGSPRSRRWISEPPPCPGAKPLDVLRGVGEIPLRSVLEREDFFGEPEHAAPIDIGSQQLALQVDHREAALHTPQSDIDVAVREPGIIGELAGIDRIRSSRIRSSHDADRLPSHWDR